jgi:thiol-disulfide isomerase/thioredoxin
MNPLVTRVLAAGMLALLFYGWYTHIRTEVREGQYPADARKETAQAIAPAASIGMDVQALAPMKVIDSATFAAAMEDSHTHPVWWMVYASWCPHCKQMFADLNRLQQEQGGNIRIITLSIDNRPEKAAAFVRSITPLHVETYIVGDAETYRIIGDTFRTLGLHYKGGMGGSGVSVPYNTVIWQGTPVAELQGALPSENIEAIVRDIIRNAK